MRKHILYEIIKPEGAVRLFAVIARRLVVVARLAVCLSKLLCVSVWALSVFQWLL